MASTIQDLRALLSARFPERKRGLEGVVSTGLANLDEALGGGVPLGRLTEWVAGRPGCGTQLALLSLLLACRQACLRVALIDPAECFAPEAMPQEAHQHLVWVRGGDLAAALGAADLLLHDGNLRLVVLDVRGVSDKQLRRWPATGWYRLQRAAEETGAALLCCTPGVTVPSAAVRLEFSEPVLGLADRLRPSSEVARRLAPVRARSVAAPEQRRAAG